MTETKKGGYSYKEWYEKNKEKIAERRKAKYREDKERRERIKANSKFTYWTKKRASMMLGEEQEEEAIEIPEPDNVIDIVIENPHDVRYGHIIKVPVFQAGKVAKLLGRTDQTLRLWEKRGVLPSISHRNAKGYRYFTLDQVQVLLDLKYLLKYSARNFEHSVFANELRKAFNNMPDGVYVEGVEDLISTN